MKERYSIENFGIEEPNVLFDNNTQQVVLTLREYFYAEIKSLQDLLNEQNSKIKELEETNKMLKGIKRYDIGELLTENIKLKQSQNSKAIEVLAKLKNNFFDYSVCFNVMEERVVRLCNIRKVIDKQITELRGG